MHVDYGLTFELQNVKDVMIVPAQGQGTLIFTDSTRPSHVNARDEALRLLTRSGNSNRLYQIFQDRGEERITRNWTNNTSAHNVAANNDHFYIRITFLPGSPQFSIVETGRGVFELSDDPNAEPTEQVHQIFIPLGSVVNRFAQHEWFISTRPEGTPGDSLRYRFVTWGNYWRLAEFVRETGPILL
jgi:hypothetical protein